MILLLAAFLRFWQLGDVPPGLSHDEVANGLIARQILAGEHSIYFTAAYGHEPLFQYLQANSVALLGDNWLGLRFPAAALGMLGLASTYLLVRYLFGTPVALLTAAWLAFSFWPLLYARVGLRAISLHFTATLGAYFLLKACGIALAGRPTDRKPATYWLLAGVLVGVSIYTYMASRVLPVILVAFLAYRFLVERSGRVPWARIAVFLLVVVLLAAPLGIWLATHPGAEFRVSEVRQPLDRLMAGDPSLVLENLVANLANFTVKGDPWPHQNIPGRPVFADWPSAILFYAGLIIALARWRDPRYGFLLIWLAGGLVPSIISAVAPSSVRDILVLTVVYVFPALAVAEAIRFLRAPGAARAAVRWALVVVALFSGGYVSVRDYLHEWPQDDSTRYFYQADLSAVAQELDRLPRQEAVVVAGLSPDSMDGPTLVFSTGRDVKDVRLCDTREALIVPAKDGSTLFVPQIAPFDSLLRDRFTSWGAQGEADADHAFVSYRLPDQVALEQDLQQLACGFDLLTGAPVACPVPFGRSLVFQGFEWVQGRPVPGENLILLTFWRVAEPAPDPLKLFVHLSAASGVPAAQHDGLGCAQQSWQTGDLLIQKHVIPLPADLPDERFLLRVGAYAPATGARLKVLAADSFPLTWVDVGE